MERVADEQIIESNHLGELKEAVFLDVYHGDIFTTAKEAVRIAKERRCRVVFNFNDLTFVVHAEDDPALIGRRYSEAYEIRRYGMRDPRCVGMAWNTGR